MLLISRALIATDDLLTLAAKAEARWWNGWWTNDHWTRNPAPLLALAAEACQWNRLELSPRCR